MAQGTLIIPTTGVLSGLSLCNDINAANSNLASCASGATDPSTLDGGVQAYSWWADTGNTLLKQRNAANNGWITIGTLNATNLGLLASSAIGSTVQAYDANTAKLNVAQSFTVAQRGAITTLTDGATITPDFAAANNFSVTLGGNRTLANPSNITAGQGGVIVITQDGTGSRTLAYGSYYKFESGTTPSLTTTASAVDVLVYYVESATRITARLVADVK